MSDGPGGVGGEHRRHTSDTGADDLSQPRRVHLIGVGGAGMSGIARVLLQRGHAVSGSDLRDSGAVDELRAMGADVVVGHDADAVGDAELVVTSTAIRADNPELQRARQTGARVVRRAEMLATLMRGSHSVLVAGTHGKTTTTSMTVVGLQAAGSDPSFAIGGQLNESGTNAHAGSDDIFVAEADESDRSFLVYQPDLAVVTNVELDHPDQFDDDGAVDAAFAQFLACRVDGATAIIGIDDAGGRRLAEAAAPPVTTFGLHPDADVAVVETGDLTTLRHDGDDLVTYHLAVPGRFNRLNAAAALLACWRLGTDLAAAAEGLAGFTGAARRFQRLGSAAGVQVVDDYAHHPTELRATLEAARDETDGRLVVVVQPHRYWRTRSLGAALGGEAAAADLVVVTEIYAAGESPMPGVSGRIVAEAAEQAGAEVVWQPHLHEVVDDLAERVQPGDLVVVTGAGDVTQVGPRLLERLRAADG